jgi:hypothetical protein
VHKLHVILDGYARFTLPPTLCFALCDRRDGSTRVFKLITSIHLNLEGTDHRFQVLLPNSETLFCRTTRS